MYGSQARYTQESSAPPTTFLTESFSGASHKRRSEGIGQLASPLHLLPLSSRLRIRIRFQRLSANRPTAAFVMSPLMPSVRSTSPFAKASGDFALSPLRYRSKRRRSLAPVSVSLYETLTVFMELFFLIV